MDMTRRGFLKALATVGAVGAGVIAIPQIRLILPDEPLLAHEKWIANVREIAQYEIASDGIWLRHDIMVKGEHFSVGSIAHGAGDFAYCRNLAATLLGNVMRQKGWAVHDLEPLPIPRGYQFMDLSGAQPWPT